MKTGKPYVMFGDGQLASCKPISEADLAAFMADCVKDSKKANQLLPIGGKDSLFVCWARSMLYDQQRALFIHAHFLSGKPGDVQSCTSDGGGGHPPGLDTHGMCRQWMRECVAGPGKAWSALEQGEYLFQLAERKPSFIKVPIALMDGIIGFLDFLTKIFPGLEVRL